MNNIDKIIFNGHIKRLQDELQDCIDIEEEQIRTINWAVKSVKDDKGCSCNCGSLFLRDLKCKKGSPHFAQRRCMGAIINPFNGKVEACDKHIKWLREDQVEYPKQ